MRDSKYATSFPAGDDSVRDFGDNPARYFFRFFCRDDNVAGILAVTFVHDKERIEAMEYIIYCDESVSDGNYYTGKTAAQKPQQSLSAS